MDVFELIRAAAAQGASDLSLVVDSQPLLRINGAIQHITDSTPLNNDDVSRAFEQLTTEEERQTFHEQMELDFGYTISAVGRLRCNVARQFNGISLAIRLLPPKIPTIDELELPQIYKDFTTQPRGLLLVSGPTDSGKSTTLATMVHHINTSERRHIVTIEDPIEYVHTSRQSAITHRQLGSHTSSFARALKHVLRQNPDVILVGEIRDLETATAVLSIAETGHLVMSTSHAPSAPQAIERIVDMFPLQERHWSETRLASLLIAVVCQVLVPRTDGSGRIAAVEIMLANSAVRTLIREGKFFQLPNVIRTHHDIGMISLDESLVDLNMRGSITYETALAFSRDHDELGKLVYSGQTGNKYH